jgi:hypothetical protein
MPRQAIATELKPLRLNFAQYCIQCGDRWCESPSCIAKHDRSRWMVCDRCDGTLEDQDGLPCGWCAFGLVEGPAPDDLVDEADLIAAVALG